MCRKPKYSEKRIQMHRTWWLDEQTPVVFRRSIVGWVAVLGEGYVVTLRQVGRTWVARKQFALEPIATATTAFLAITAAKNHYDRFYSVPKEGK